MSGQSAEIAIRFAAAVGSHQEGDWDRAEAGYRGILATEPEHTDCLHLLGVLDHQRGHHAVAAERIAAAIRLRPGQAAYHNNLGVALRAAGRLEAAGAAYREAVRLDARYGDALSNLGVALHEWGDAAGAAAAFERALEVDGDHVDALYGLGNLLASQGRFAAAVDRFRHALGLAPHRADVRNNLGGALAGARRFAEAEVVFRRVVDDDPGPAAGWANLGGALEELGRLGEAADALAEAARRTPEGWHWPIRIAALCPAVFPDREAIARYRIGLEAVLDAHRGGVALPPDAAGAAGCAPPFLLPHHGFCDRTLKEKYARLYRGQFPDRPARVAAGPGPIRVGFFANSPHHGGFLRVIGGIVERLDPGQFRPVVIGDAPALPALRAGIRRPDAEFVTIPPRLPAAADRIAACDCDVLYHWQVGTDPLNYFLAHHRLAPVQCTSWGSHVTTGVPAIDYFLSSRWIEAENAEAHYSEELVRLVTFPTFEPRPQLLGSPAARPEFGLPAGSHLYMCLQRLAKFHPDFDAMLGAILRRDPAGLVVALAGEPHETAALRDRLAAAIPDQAERVVFLPRQTHDRYLRLLSLADVVLDTPYFGCGHTGYDALGLNLPIVTWPGRFKVGRYVLAYYRRLGMDQCVADSPAQYVEQAVRLGTDPAWRAEVVQRLMSRVADLFSDEEVVREHERFFLRAIDHFRRR